MARLPADIAEFMQEHGVTSDEVWPVPGGKAYAVKHKAIERIAIHKGITFDPPTVIQANAVEKVAVICVTGHIPANGKPAGTAWSIGEASPANNKNQYPFAMAEKRAKDRVVLKLLQAHGALYSEDEADEFREQEKLAGAPADDAEPTSFGDDPAQTVLDSARTAAMNGTQALREWWKSATHDERAIFDTQSDKLKTAAAEADKLKTRSVVEAG